MNMFCHFGPNTFSGAEWGDGTETEDIFNPTALNCSQWVDVASQVGFGGIILTAKHHDGFCLWPSSQSTHTVAQSSWNEGHGDVLREFVDACSGRIKAGVYISPWDRNHPTYGTDDYNNVFINTLREVHTQYGPMFEQWFDGACGEGPNGKQQRYDWPRYMHTMNELNMHCIIFSDIGPGCRWIGNEEGYAGETCWSTLNTEGATPSENKPSPDELTTGHRNGCQWIPAEVDVSIRPGWFWHANEHPKTVKELIDIYFNSVGRNGLLLLNVPPDTNGRICTEDSLRLMEFRAELDRLFAHDIAQGAHIKASGSLGHKYKVSNALDTAYHNYWAAKDTLASVEMIVTESFDIIMLQEYIPMGQKVERFYIEGLTNGHWSHLYDGTSIGYKRLIRLPQPVKTDAIRITFHAASPVVINRIALYNSRSL